MIPALRDSAGLLVTLLTLGFLYLIFTIASVLGSLLILIVAFYRLIKKKRGR